MVVGETVRWRPRWRNGKPEWRFNGPVTPVRESEGGGSVVGGDGGGSKVCWSYRTSKIRRKGWGMVAIVSVVATGTIERFERGWW